MRVEVPVMFQVACNINMSPRHGDEQDAMMFQRNRSNADYLLHGLVSFTVLSILSSLFFAVNLGYSLAQM
jgi:hypothetical protein